MFPAKRQLFFVPNLPLHPPCPVLPAAAPTCLLRPSYRRCAVALPAVPPPPPANRGPRQGHLFRLCVSTRVRKHRSELFRVVRVGPKRAVVIDDKGIGRSAYVSKTLEAVQEARKRNRIGRAVRAKVPDAIYDELERMAAEIKGLGEGERGG